jgi:hypothetical protein
MNKDFSISGEGFISPIVLQVSELKLKQTKACKILLHKKGFSRQS